MKELITERYERWKRHYKDDEIVNVDPNMYPVMFSVEEAHSILIEELPSSSREIAIVSDANKRQVYQFCGSLQKESDDITIFIWYNFKPEEWTLPLSPIYHIDLIKRVVEWKKENDSNLRDLSIVKSNENSICFSFTPSIEKSASLFEVFAIGKEIDEWCRATVFELQNIVGDFHLKFSSQYSVSNLLDNNELLNRIINESDSNKKGQFLEELISRLFQSIPGFDVRERVRTATEEIDILILNKSSESIWNKESSLVLIECKNWSSKCGKDEFVVFKEKLANRYGRAKIGFLVSWNGFAKTIDQELLRSSQSDVIIILVTGQQVIEGMKSPNFGDVVEKWWMNSLSK